MTDWKVVWRGQTWGRPSDPLGVADFGELFNSAKVNTSTTDGGGDGSFPGETWLGERTFNLHLIGKNLVGDAAVEAQLANIEAATVPAADRQAEEAITIRRPGWDADRFLLVKPTDRQVSSSVDKLGVGYLEAILQFTAFDPTWYSAQHTISAFGTGAGAQTVTNAGNYSPTRGRRLWTAHLEGPLTFPKLFAGDGSDGRGIEYVGTLASGHHIDIDSSVMSIVLDGTTDLYDACAGTGGFPYPGFWEIPVGTSTVTLTADAGAGTATFTYRDTWG